MHLHSVLLIKHPHIPLLTSTHQIVPEEREAKPQRKHHQVGSDAWEEFGKARCLCAEIEEGSSCQDSVGMESHHVVLPRVQLCCLHQLDTGMKPKGARVSAGTSAGWDTGHEEQTQHFWRGVFCTYHAFLLEKVNWNSSLIFTEISLPHISISSYRNDFSNVPYVALSWSRCCWEPTLFKMSSKTFSNTKDKSEKRVISSTQYLLIPQPEEQRECIIILLHSTSTCPTQQLGVDQRFILS